MTRGTKRETTESLLLAYESPNSGSCTSSEDEYFEPKHLQRRKLCKRSRNCHCNIRRMLRMMLCSLMPILLLLYCLISEFNELPERHYELLDWGYNTSKNISDYIYPERDSVLLEPRNVCSEKVFLYIVVCSSAQNFAERQTVRRTWGNVTEFNYGMFAQMHAHMKGEYLDVLPERVRYYSDYLGLQNNTIELPAILPVKVVFLVGRSISDTDNMQRIQEESQQYNDLIQQDFADTYNNLTIKSVFALKWMLERCSTQVAFFMKCDDDTFVNIPNLLHYLLGGTVPIYNDTLELYDIHSSKALSKGNRLNSTHDYLAGHLFCMSRPVADRYSKWYMPYYMYPKDQYPKYLSGSGYLMSIDVVSRLYHSALKMPLLYLEDIYVTGLCAIDANIVRKHVPIINFTYINKPCSFKGTIVQHNLKKIDSIMMTMYNAVINMNITCPPPNKLFKRIRLGFGIHCSS